MLLARLGIIWATGTRIKVYDTEWGLLSMGAITTLHAKLEQGFRQGEFGPCETLAGIVGTTKAAEMADANCLPKRVFMSQSQKRPREASTDDDNQPGPSRLRRI